MTGMKLANNHKLNGRNQVLCQDVRSIE